jgi:ribonuclease HI
VSAAGTFVLRTDGGARGNPGPAGVGFVLECPDGTVARRGGRPIGPATNNAAEYRALIWGLRTAIDAGVSRIEVRSDSELVVRQVNGVYRVKDAGLQPLHREVCGLLDSFAWYRVVHVPRAENVAADELVNRALDSGEELGDGVSEGGAPRLFD